MGSPGEGSHGVAEGLHGLRAHQGPRPSRMREAEAIAAWDAPPETRCGHPRPDPGAMGGYGWREGRYPEDLERVGDCGSDKQVPSRGAFPAVRPCHEISVRDASPGRWYHGRRRGTTHFDRPPPLPWRMHPMHLIPCI